MAYEKMTLKELEKEKAKIFEEIAKLKAKARSIQRVQDTKSAEANVARKIESMTDAEKKIATQILGPKGIKSEEKVGVPGTK
jgi:hypothetical protein